MRKRLCFLFIFMAVIILSLQARQYIGSPTTREIVEIEIAENLCQIEKIERKYDVNMMSAILAIVYIESDFKRGLIEKEINVNDYSIGLTQMRRDTARWIGKYKNLTDAEIERRLLIPSINMRLGIKYFCWQINRYDGNFKRAVSAYNAGTYTKANAYYYKRWLKAYNKYNKEANIYYE